MINKLNFLYILPATIILQQGFASIYFSPIARKKIRIWKQKEKRLCYLEGFFQNTTTNRQTVK